MSVVCVLNVRIPENVFGSYSRKIFFNFLIEDTVTRKMTIRYHHPSIHPSIYPSIHPSIPFEQVRYSIIFCFAVLELFVISVGKNSRQTSIWFEFLAVFFFFFFCERCANNIYYSDVVHLFFFSFNSSSFSAANRVKDTSFRNQFIMAGFFPFTFFGESNSKKSLFFLSSLGCGRPSKNIKSCKATKKRGRNKMKKKKKEEKTDSVKSFASLIAVKKLYSWKVFFFFITA